jgi:16S rRNA processing protein RimM
VVTVEAGGISTPRRIVSVRFQQGRPVIALEGVETMSAAEALAGAALVMPRSSMPPLPAGTFHRDELIGCEVRDTTDGVIGRVTAVDGPMDRSHLVVDGGRGEILIPLNAGICVRVDPAAGVIVVDPPEGLLQLNDRRSQS